MVSDVIIGAVVGMSGSVSIRFEVRGGFRPADCRYCDGRGGRVSIRFEVRGGFRRPLQGGEELH